ncbi:uncharacterized protein LOC141692634 isoform X3 [Apium graveolens]|uniref:uncharacterized protein LOC141692634 isoform X3 n=1 Tax=Apium graveolens TaxID=4045 RepID=UPI003D7B2A16
MEKVSGLGHLFITVFFYSFSTFMVIPAITDVTMSAICPGEDECSLAIYLSAVQQAITGLGTLFMMPLMGNLSDAYGRKAVLTVPMALTVFPLVTLAYSRSKYFVYAYYVLKTITSMVCEGSVACLALAYVADNITEKKRASAFGILSGISSCAFVATGGAVIAVVYMRIFLAESPLAAAVISQKETEYLLRKSSPRTSHSNTATSFSDAICLLRNSSTFSGIAIITFFGSLAEIGLHGSILYYLKAEYHYNKDQFADLMIINGIAATISQMLLMPVLAPVLKEDKMVTVGLFFSCAQIVLYSLAWSSWVPYMAAMFSAVSVFAPPCIRSIASKQVGLSEQGKAQGCIAGICSLSNVVSPLIFSPLTALFLSDSAPFHFPGFSLMCCSLAAMIAFIKSAVIKEIPRVSTYRVDSVEPLV